MIGVFTVVPLVYVGYLSLADLKAGEAVGAFVGTANYEFVLQDRSTMTAFRNTFYFSTVSVLLASRCSSMRMRPAVGCSWRQQSSRGRFPR